jgi:molecular chaperone DnaK
MVQDAEAHAEDDRRQLEAVQARNQLDTLVHSVKKSIGEYGDKIGDEEKAKIETAVKDAEALLKDNEASKEAMASQAEALGKAAQKLGEIMYAESQAKSEASGADPSAGGGAGTAGSESGKKEETVVDAEYTEVKDKK